LQMILVTYLPILVSEILKIEFEFWNKWLIANILPLNFEKTHFMQFITKNIPPIDLDISYTNKLISKVYNTKFLGIYVDRTRSCKHHVRRITHKLSVACYGLRSVKPFISQEILTVVYYPYFHFIMNYELIFFIYFHIP
jgi:hypothetical protein